MTHCPPKPNHLDADPADTVKARLQVQGAAGSSVRYASTWKAFTQMARAEGAAGFYRGFPAVAAGSVPATCAYYAG